MRADTGQKLIVLKAQPPGWVLEGELSFASVPELLGQGLKEFNFSSTVHLDLGGIKHADSAGLALLLEWMDIARRSGGSLSLSQLPESLLDIARMSNVEGLLPLNR